MLEFFNDITFANKELRWLFLVIPFVIAWYVWKNKTYHAELRSSTISGLEKVRPSLKQNLRYLIPVLRILAIAALIIVLMRPQSKSSWKDVKTEGIDIVLSIDISFSMLAKDFKPNRLKAAKDVAQDFIDSRPNDRIGLVIFSGESFTQCPLTSDHAVIKNLLENIEPGMLAGGTAIGDGLATAVARVQESKAKSKVVILLTDGVNNQGSVAPLSAAEIAKIKKVRVYTIGVGTIGKALSPTGVIYPDGSLEYAYADVDVDDKTLEAIADYTGGKYFRATGNTSLKEVYKEIDRMEKTIFEEKNFTNKAERYLPFAITATILLLLEFLIRNTFLKSIV